MRYFLAFLISFFIAAHPVAAEPSLSRAIKILNEVDDMWRGKSSFARFSMSVKTANYTRTMKMEGWSKGKERSLIKIIYPLKEKGTSTLKSGNNIYTYLPKTDRTIRITSGMMMGSWMGSHFTNDDLVKESRLSEDYDVTISFEGERDGKKIMEFTLLPKPDAAVVWGKIVLTTLSIQDKNIIPVKEIYYDEDLTEMRVMTFTDVKMLGGKMRPAIMRIEPRDKPGEYTELVYSELKFDIALDDSFFSLAKLRRK